MNYLTQLSNLAETVSNELYVTTGKEPLKTTKSMYSVWARNSENYMIHLFTGNYKQTQAFIKGLSTGTKLETILDF